MRASEDPPPSYEDVITGGDPPKYSSVAGPREEEIRICPNVTTNQNTPRIPQSAPGRAPRGKWYGNHNMVPSFAPVRTMCQREASQDAMRSHRLWIQQEGSLTQLTTPPVPNKEFSNCCLIILMAAVVLSLLVLLQPWGGPYASYSGRSIDLASEELEEKKPMIPEEKSTPQSYTPYCKSSACFGAAPSIKDATFVPALRPHKCQDAVKNMFSDKKPVNFFELGERFSVTCQSIKVLSISPSFLDPDYTGQLVRNMEIMCTQDGWVYRLNHKGQFFDWRTRSFNKTEANADNNFHGDPSNFYDSVRDKSSNKNNTVRNELSNSDDSVRSELSHKDERIHQVLPPVECITETELIKRSIG